MDLYFYIFASLGVFVFGLSKGGVPGPIAMLAVPVMSFVMSPLQAAGILLPLLIIMDFSAIYLYWKKWINSILKIIYSKHFFIDHCFYIQPLNSFTDS